MIRSIVTLLSGNALAQLVNILTVLLVVAVFILPDQFGRYALAMSYVGILSAVACLRYEVAIVAATSDRVANVLTALSVLLAVISSLLIYAVFELLHLAGFDAVFFGVPAWLLVITILGKALTQVVACNLYRREAYTSYSAAKLIQALALLGGFWWAGQSTGSAHGLLLATALSYLVFVAVAAPILFRYQLAQGVSLRRIRYIAVGHKDFVYFNSPHALVDNLLSNGVVVVIAASAGPAIAGYFGFLQRIIRAPLGLVFTAVGQVLFRFASKNRGNAALVQREIRRLNSLTVSFLVFTALAIVSAYIWFDSIAFLSGWSGMRAYLLAMAAWMLVPFIFSPYAALPVVYQRQKTFFFIATSFNVLALALMFVLLSQAMVQTTFYFLSAIATFYFLAMSLWTYRLTSHG